ncbi:hypothetical protein OHS18_46835 [Amycolatopsis sp. NBC_00355]|uniref:hypothetical protein n=1 Tax=Amycolatopsis sp. NBC_00355 TaxID=2975957 RepID=UPI002E25727C
MTWVERSFGYAVAAAYAGSQVPDHDQWPGKIQRKSSAIASVSARAFPAASWSKISRSSFAFRSACQQDGQKSGRQLAEATASLLKAPEEAIVHAVTDEARQR